MPHYEKIVELLKSLSADKQQAALGGLMVLKALQDADDEAA